MSQPEEESQPTTKPTGFPPYVEKLLTGKELSRYWFPVGKAITKEYVKAVCGVQTYNWTDREYGVIMKKMARDKKEIYSYSKGQIESTILANIRKDGVEVATFSKLRDMFCTNSSPNFAAKLWTACYGSFDEKRWELEMEEQYMTLNEMTYEDKSYPDKIPKGCFAREISRCKCELLKSLNKAAKKAHGGQIRIKRMAEEVQGENKWKRRKKGEALGKFFNLVDDEKPVAFYAKLEETEVEDKQVSYLPFFVIFVHVCILRTLFHFQTKKKSKTKKKKTEVVAIAEILSDEEERKNESYWKVSLKRCSIMFRKVC